MDDSNKKAKKGPRRGKNEEATADEMIFGNKGADDMVNFGGGANDNLGEEFGEKQREPNIIRKLLNTINSSL
jgi:hypothetical protein